MKLERQGRRSDSAVTGGFTFARAGLALVFVAPLAGIACSAPFGLEAEERLIGGDDSGAETSTITIGPPDASKTGGGDSGEATDAGAPPTGGDDSGPDRPDATPSCGADASVQYCGASTGCVDTTTSSGNCGECGKACPVPTNGAASCTGGSCGITCGATYVACNGSCVPNTGEPAVDPCAIATGSGIFVAPTGVLTAAGSEAAPVPTIAKGIALAKAAGVAVYVCDATYVVPLVLGTAQDGVKIYGGMVCPGTGVTNAWAYEGGTVTIAPTTAGATALTISGLTTGVTFEDFSFTSSNASGVDANGNGESSIAVSVSGSTGVVFRRVSMTAGTGAPGTAGVTEGANTLSKADGGASPPSSSLASGGAGCGATCPNGQSTQGGGGGGGGPIAAYEGQAGYPDLSADAGLGGIAETTSNGSCTNGTRGLAGIAGSTGAGSQTRGALTSSGWSPGAAGGTGSAGQTAQGGGGGGGALYPSGSTPTGGGGGGACGGCGGGYGTGGAAGGSSIAIVSISSGVVLDDCMLTAANAGVGGAGGAGQVGQLGGDKGEEAGNGCQGGQGGNGGNGGGGGVPAGDLSLSDRHQRCRIAAPGPWGIGAGTR